MTTLKPFQLEVLFIYQEYILEMFLLSHNLHMIEFI